MKFTPLSADFPVLWRDDDSAVALDAMVDALVAEIKRHGHFGNLAHHIAKGDWKALAAAMHQVFFDRCSHEDISPLARNVARASSGSGPSNIGPFRQWLLDHFEAESSTLHRVVVERRIDALNEEIRHGLPVWRKSASHILSSL